MIQFISKWWPSGICIAVILYATLASNPTPDVDMSFFPHIDKLIHAIMFGGVTGALAFDYERANRVALPMLRKKILVYAAFIAIFAVADEIAQALFTETRAAEVWDAIADFSGIAIAVVMAPPVIMKVLRIR